MKRKTRQAEEQSVSPEEQDDLDLAAWIGEKIATIPPSGWEGLRVLLLMLANNSAWGAVNCNRAQLLSESTSYLIEAGVYRGLFSVLEGAVEQGRQAKDAGGIATHAPVGNWPWAWGSAGQTPQARKQEAQDETDLAELEAGLSEEGGSGHLIAGRRR